MRVPGAGLLDEGLLDRRVEDRARLRDALAVDDVELGLAEGRGELVLHDLDLRANPDRLRALLDRVLAAHVEPHGRVELQRAPAGRRFRRSEEHADLLADLVDEDDRGARARDGGGEFPERLGHEPRLQPGQRVAHVAVELGARHQRRDRVDDDHVHGVGAHEGLRDLERLLAGVGLGDQELVGVDAEVLRVDRVERVLGIDEGGDPPEALRLGDDVERERRLAGGLRPVDLRHAAAGNPADPERDIEGDRARGNDGDLVERAAGAELHDGALAELPLDLRDGQVQRLPPVALHLGHTPLHRPDGCMKCSI